MDSILVSRNKVFQKSFVAIQVSSVGLTEEEAKLLRTEITKALGKVKRKRRHDLKPRLHFFSSFNLK